MADEGAGEAINFPDREYSETQTPDGELAWDYPEPDPVSQRPDSERAGSDDIVNEVFFLARGVGNFVRATLPVHVESDREATFRVWLIIPDMHEWDYIEDRSVSRDLQDWWNINFVGVLCTAVRPWPDVFGAWVVARVTRPVVVPRIVHSTNPLLTQVMNEVWPEATIRSARGRHTPRPLTKGPNPPQYSELYGPGLRGFPDNPRAFGYGLNLSGFMYTPGPYGEAYSSGPFGGPGPSA